MSEVRVAINPTLPIKFIGDCSACGNPLTQSGSVRQTHRSVLRLTGLQAVTAWLLHRCAMGSKHEAPMTPIEKIRAEVLIVLADHDEGAEPLCECGWAVRLAEEKLKLAEALELIRTREEWDAEDSIGNRTPEEVAERVLAEVAR